MKKAIIVVFLSCLSVFAQKPDKNDWRVLPDPPHKPNRVLRFLKHNAPWIGPAVAIPIVGVVGRQKSCHEYAPGRNGVNVWPCPKDGK